MVMYFCTSKILRETAAGIPVVAPSTVPRWSAMYISEELMTTGVPPRAVTVSAVPLLKVRIFSPLKSSGTRRVRLLLKNCTRP